MYKLKAVWVALPWFDEELMLGTKVDMGMYYIYIEVDWGSKYKFVLKSKHRGMIKSMFMGYLGLLVK